MIQRLHAFWLTGPIRRHSSGRESRRIGISLSMLPQSIEEGGEGG